MTTPRLVVLVVACVAGFALEQAPAMAAGAVPLGERAAHLEAEVTAAEDLRAIKRLQRTYGYYLDKGMWTDLAEFFADDAVANYPAGVFIGKESIRRHLYLNVGNVRFGEVGLGDNRLYNHMNIQPVVHLDPGGQTAKGRWRAYAYFGGMGGGASWAEGIYEMQYAKLKGVWKISSLQYYAGFGVPYSTGWAAPAAPAAAPPGDVRAPAPAAPPTRARRVLAYPADRSPPAGRLHSRIPQSPPAPTRTRTSRSMRRVGSPRLRTALAV